MSSARDWLQLARVSNTPTTVSNTVAGAVLVDAAAPAGPVAVVAVAMALVYTARMVLDDVFDLAIDRRERPDRPLPSGRISVPAAITAVGFLFVAGELPLFLEGWRDALAGLVLIALIVLYDAWHEGNPLSPVLMGTCRAMVYVVAGLAIADALNAELWGAAAVMLVYLVGLTQVAKAEGGGRAGALAVCFAAFAATVQSTCLTGQSPSGHGAVGNGRLYRATMEARLWQPSNRLVQAPKVWETADVSCANLCTKPGDLRDRLQAALGQFPLLKFWGPAA